MGDARPTADARDTRKRRRLMIDEHEHRDARSQSTATSDIDASYQVDVMVTLFAVLLVILVLTLQVTRTADGERSLWDYKKADDQTEPFGLRSAAAPYKFRSIWIFREGQALLLDQIAVAEIVAASGPNQQLIPAPPSVDVKIEQKDADWNDYVMSLRIYDSPKDSPLFSQVLPLDDVDAVVDAIYATGEDGLFIYVWSDMKVAAIAVEDALRDAGTPFEIVDLEPGKRTIELRRDGAAAGLVGMQRSY